MKSIMFFTLTLVAVAVAAPSKPIEIVYFESTHQPGGDYFFKYETENGITREEHGELKEVFDEEKKPHHVVVIRGSFSYPKEEGKTLFFTYTADENGYHTQGDAVHTNY